MALHQKRLGRFAIHGTTRPATSEDRTLKDFLYAFSISYGMNVNEARATGQKIPNREHQLKIFCKRWLEEGNLTTHAKAVIESIIEYSTSTTQTYPGIWIPVPAFIFDSWFELLIGKEHKHPTARQIPSRFVNDLKEQMPPGM